MESTSVFTALCQLRVTTERIERANGMDEMARAIEERAGAVQRVANIIDRDKCLFSTADLTQLRELYGRGADILADIQQARRKYCLDGAELHKMRHILSSFLPSA